MFTIMFFGTHEYDHYYFDVLAQDPAYGCRIRYLAANLDADTAPLAQGGDFQGVVCAMEQCGDDLELQGSAAAVLANSLRDVPAHDALGRALAATQAVEAVAGALRRLRELVA